MDTPPAPPGQINVSDKTGGSGLQVSGLLRIQSSSLPNRPGDCTQNPSISVTGIFRQLLI